MSAIEKSILHPCVPKYYRMSLVTTKKESALISNIEINLFKKKMHSRNLTAGIDCLDSSFPHKPDWNTTTADTILR